MMKQLLFPTIAIFSAIFFCGCGKPAPEPPRVRTELVLEIFDSLQRKDHKNALAKIERLKELDPTNVFLSEFEHIERANIRIQEAEEALLRNDRKRAELAIQDAIRVIGPLQPLVSAANEITQLAELEILAEKIANPTTSAALEQSLAEFNRKISKFQTNAKFREFAQKRIPVVKQLKEREDQITLNDLTLDMHLYGKRGKSLWNTMESQKKIEQKQ